MPSSRLRVAPVLLVPTFPLDQVRIERSRYMAIMRSPRFLFARGAAAFGKAMLQLGIGQRVGRTALATWAELDQELTLEIVRELVERSNESQDEALLEMQQELSSSGNVEYAIALGKFLLLKQHVEGKLHAEGPLTDRKQEIESLVDSICQEICNEISRLAAGKAALTDVLTSNDEKQLQQLTERMTSGHRRIMSAYTTLSETAKQLNPQLDPLPPEAKHSEESHVLDRLLEVLRDENEITRNVEERLRSELPPSR